MTGSDASTPERLGPEDGLSLIEVVVALVVFALFSTALVAALIQIQSTSRNDRQRVSAAGLAQAQIESLRDLPTAQIPLGQTTFAKNVGTQTFTVTQNVEYVADNAAPTCTATGGIAYKRISELVSWPGMGGIKPVRTDTLRALNINGLDPTKGSLSVLVTGQGATAAAPQSGVSVTVTDGAYGPTTIVTGDDGCAVFAGLPPGTATAATAMTGYATTSQATSTTTTVSVTAGTLTKGYLTYAPAGTAVLAPSTSTSLPLSLTVKSSTSTRAVYDCSASSAPCVTGQPRTVALYPDPATLVWAGTCADADPAVSPNNRAAYEVNPGLKPGTTSAATTLYLATASLTNTGSTSKTFYAEHVADASCAAGEIYTVGTLAPGASTTVALPFGTWTFSSTNSIHPYVANSSDGQAQLTPASGTLAVSAK